MKGKHFCLNYALSTLLHSPIKSTVKLILL